MEPGADESRKGWSCAPVEGEEVARVENWCDVEFLLVVGNEGYMSTCFFLFLRC